MLVIGADHTFFETRIRPLLAEHCYRCHSAQAKKLRGGLHLDRRTAAFKGGESGVAIVPGKPDESLLLSAIRYREESLEMPPDGKLPAKAITAFEEWVAMGAPWPEDQEGAIAAADEGFDFAKFRREHWAFRPVTKASLPGVATATWPRKELDYFVLAKLERAGIEPSPEADRRTLIRRAWFDLAGLPPAAEIVDEFVSGKIGWARVVDDLLASPHYGERWARHWLDVARYSDGLGGFLDNGALPQAWRYRDWVVAALNADMPYDEFLRQQIAGDLDPTLRDGAIATGFFAVGPTYRSDGGDPEAKAQALAETLSDRIDTLSQAFLGLTVACARCHDHKFDPVTMRDYYALAGIFNNTRLDEHPLAPPDEVKAWRELDGRIRKLDAEVKRAKKKGEDVAERKRELESLKSSLPPKFQFAHVLKDGGNADMHVAIRGDLRKHGELVPRRFLEIFGDTAAFAEGSGRRELARAVTDPANPLVARVFVNRVWQWHFGAGLVRTPSNFGVLGEAPSHPGLLDWLTADFVAHGWSIKRLHRQILHSATWRMTSAYRENAFARDGDNRLLWRMSPQRLEVEAWRDALLAVSGRLDRSLGGAPDREILQSRRRTLYATISRNGDRFRSDEFLRNFDFPAPRTTAAGRTVSTVPQQYLFMLNSDFFGECADALAQRLREGARGGINQVRLAYRLLFQRAPDRAEVMAGNQFLANGGSLTSYAQALLSSEEFRLAE